MSPSPKTAPEDLAALEASRMPFMGHLAELRRRLVVAAIAVGVGFGVCLPFQERLLAFMIDPLKAVLPKGQRLIYTSLPEAFFTYFKVCLLGGALLAAPVIFLQIWRFVAPGLYRHERKYASLFVVTSSLLFFAGAFFGYRVVFPYAFQYFVSFDSDLLQALPALQAYFSLTLHLLLAFGVMFELPVVMFILGRMGVVTDKFLRKNRKWAILLAFIAAAILTPTPDAVNQCLMAGPLLLLYEISIWVVKFFGKKAAPEEKPTSPPAPPDPPVPSSA